MRCYCNIKRHPERISEKWQGLEFPLATLKIGNFEKNSSGITVIILLNSKKGTYKACRSEKV